MIKNIIKKVIEYIFIFIICAIIASVVYAHEYQEFETYHDQQMVLNTQLVEAIEMLVQRIQDIQHMRGI